MLLTYQEYYYIDDDAIVVGDMIDSTGAEDECVTFTTYGVFFGAT